MGFLLDLFVCDWGRDYAEAEADERFRDLPHLELLEGGT